MNKATEMMPLMRHKRSQNAGVLYTLVDEGVAVVDTLMRISANLVPVRRRDCGKHAGGRWGGEPVSSGGEIGRNPSEPWKSRTASGLPTPRNISATEIRPTTTTKPRRSEASTGRTTCG